MKYYYKDYFIEDETEGKFPVVPSVKMVGDIQSVIKRVVKFDNLFDFLQIYNATGLIVFVVKWYAYTTPEGNEHEFSVKYSMFGTNVNQVNSDNFDHNAESGAFTNGPTSTWDAESHIYAEKNIWGNHVDYVRDMNKFYKLNFSELTTNDDYMPKYDEGTIVSRAFIDLPSL